MMRWRIWRSHPDWAILPERPWNLAYRANDNECWAVAGGPYQTWQHAVDRLVQIWTVY